MLLLTYENASKCRVMYKVSVSVMWCKESEDYKICFISAFGIKSCWAVQNVYHKTLNLLIIFNLKYLALIQFLSLRVAKSSASSRCSSGHHDDHRSIIVQPHQPACY